MLLQEVVLDGTCRNIDFPLSVTFIFNILIIVKLLSSLTYLWLMLQYFNSLKTPEN